MKTEAILLTAVQVAKLLNEMIQLREAGKLSDEEVQERWAQITNRVHAADAAWVAAGQS